MLSVFKKACSKHGLCFFLGWDRIAYVEFATEAVAEKMIEEAQGADVQGRSIIIDYTGEKRGQGGRAPGWLNCGLAIDQMLHFSSLWNLR